MKDIAIDLSEQSIARAIQELKAYQLAFPAKITRAWAILCEGARDYCQSLYGAEVVVTGESSADGFIITATGRGVGFLEFGAGTMTDTEHPLAENAPFDVYPGSYSETNKRLFELYGYWVFGGRIYTYVMPQRCLYQTSIWVWQNIERVFKEVFSS